MTGDAKHEQRGYSFRLEPTAWKSRDLVYEEPGHRLVVYLEMSGLRSIDWVGCDTDFQTWTDPPGEPISTETRTELLRRLNEWARGQRLRIEIGPPVDREAYFAELEREGCVVERKPDGTVVVTPPKRSFWQRLVGLTRVFLRNMR